MTPRYWSNSESKISARAGASGSPSGAGTFATISSSTSSLQLQREAGDRWYVGSALAGIAALAAQAGSATDAARLLGVAEACWEHGSGGLWPSERGRLTATVATLRSRLGEETYQREVA